MKKRTKILNYIAGSALGLSLLGVLSNKIDISSSRSSLENQIARCFYHIPSESIVSKEIEKKYSEEEILGIIGKAYDCAKNKPHYFNKRLFEGIARKESELYQRAKSKKGALGLYQFMPPVWEEQTKELYGRELPFSFAKHPRLNAEVALHHALWINSFSERHYVNWNTVDEKSKRRVLMASWNGGAPRLLSNKWDISLMPLETRRYVQAISSAIEDED